MTFAKLGLSKPITEAISAMGYNSPTPIQEKAIPAVLNNQDIMAAAPTGTGKTGAFVLPILEKLRQGPRCQSKEMKALIMTPTRELAAQIEANVTEYARHLKLRHQAVFGGVKINGQIRAMVQGCEIVIATPGRLLDLHGQGAIDFSKLEILVLDEADRMLDMGFIRDMQKIFKLLPKSRQNMLFSATFSKEIQKLAKDLLDHPAQINYNPENRTAERVEQFYTGVDKSHKTELFKQLFKQHKWQQVLVFTRTKHGANRLTRQLESAKISAAAIHGNKSQNARTKALEGFKAGEIEVLVATDIASRGLDIKQLPQIVNYDLPNVAEDYVHRIGRTGRAGEPGTAFSLVSQEQMEQFEAIEKFTNQKIPELEVEGFTVPLKRGVKAAKPKPNNNRNRSRRNNGNGNGNGKRNNNRPARQRSGSDSAKPNRQPRRQQQSKKQG